MFKKILFLAWAVLTAAAGPVLAQEAALSFSEADRLLVIAPHPDDETLGLGGMLQRAKASGAVVRVLYLTNGESNEVASIFFQKRPLLLRSDFVKSGALRKSEALDAMTFLGLGERELVFFGYPDGGMLTIWLKYWGSAKPFRSLFTRLTHVPYKDNFSAGRPFKGDEITRDLERVLLEFKPTAVFVTAPFDLNTDHQAAFLYLQVALLDLRGQLERPPDVRLYVVHAHQWPQPKAYRPDEALEVPTHIDWSSAVSWHGFPLKKNEVRKKADTLLAYRSQMAYKKDFLLAFARKNELFAEYPTEKIKAAAGPVLENGPFEGPATGGDVRYKVVEDELWIEIPLSSALDEMGVLSSYVFGWRNGSPFSQMPKLTFKLFGNKMFVTDGARNFHDPELVYRLENERLLIRVPMRVLKDPEVLFVSTRNAKEELSLDFGSWRTLELVL